LEIIRDKKGITVAHIDNNFRQCCQLCTKEGLKGCRDVSAKAWGKNVLIIRLYCTNFERKLRDIEEPFESEGERTTRELTEFYSEKNRYKSD
jgi:hypothetical protein